MPFKTIFNRLLPSLTVKIKKASAREAIADKSLIFPLVSLFLRTSAEE